MVRPVIEAIRSGDVSLAKKLLQTHKYTCIDCQTHRKDGTALFWAASRGLLEVVQILLSRGANVNARTGYDATPLHAAADANKVHVIRLLLEWGADINSCTVLGDSPCHLAAYRGHYDAVNLLVQCGAALDILNRKYRRPIDEAAANANLDIVDYLAAFSQSQSTHSLNCLTSVPEPILCEDSECQQVQHMNCYPVSVHCHGGNLANARKLTNSACGVSSIALSDISDASDDDNASVYVSSNDLSLNANRGSQCGYLQYMNIPFTD